METLKFGVYLVDKEGNITDNTEPKKPRLITADRLKEPDWLIFYRTDPSVIWNDLMPAIFEAQDRAEIKLLQFKTDL